jgi:6-phosphofructokinase 1
VDGSIAIQRASTNPYEPRLVRVPLEAVAAKTRHMPDEFINAEGNHVTPKFVEWLRPLIGEMPVVGRL